MNTDTKSGDTGVESEKNVSVEEDAK